MRVCLVSPDYADVGSAGGIATYTRSLATELAAAGHDVTVLTRHGGGDSSPSRVRTADGVLVSRSVAAVRPTGRLERRLTRRALGDPGLRRASRATAAAVDREVQAAGAFDVIEVPLWDAEASEFPDDLAQCLVTRIMTPIFKVTEILEQPPFTGLEILERRQLDKSRLVLSISDAIGRLVASHYDLDQAKFRYAPLAVEPQPRAEPRGHTSTARVLFVGRLERRKGVDDLILAMTEVLERVPNATFDIVGEDQAQSPVGSYLDFFAAVVPAALQRRVTFHGFLDSAAVARLYDECDLFVAPSRYESFGLVYLEAMAHGAPVVGTRVGGVPEVVDGEVGVLVEPQRPDELAAAISALLLDADRRIAMSAAGLARVRNHFTPGAMTHATTAVYDEAAALRSGGAG